MKKSNPPKKKAVRGNSPKGAGSSCSSSESLQTIIEEQESDTALLKGIR